MKALRLRNLTTGLLHTKIDDVYEDLVYITGIQDHVIHENPDIMKKIKLWLIEHIPDEEYWNGEYSLKTTGDYPLEPMTNEEKKQIGIK